MMRATLEPVESRLMMSAVRLSSADVNEIISQAAAVSLRSQAIVVVDRRGDILGIFGQGEGVQFRDEFIQAAAQRARTAALFESRQNAFTTRTARFIIQDHFPQPIANTPGGPLYGVEFSSLPGSDVLPAGQASGISGDPGGVPLYIDGTPVGAIGVAGDGSDIAPRADLVPTGESFAPTAAQASNPKGRFYTGTEETDFDEAVAMAGSKGFTPPDSITADKIFVGGLRLPYVAESAATVPLPNPALTQPTDDRSYQSFVSLGAMVVAPIDTPASPYPFAVIANTPGTMKNPSDRAATGSLVPGNATSTDMGIIPSLDANGLTAADVEQVITQAVVEANSIRAGIRQPIGVAVKVHISVVDREGRILGVFRMADGTNFSYDVAVQKARTAAYFSDDTHAFSARAIGFMAQRFFPSGIDNGITGPLFHLQDELSMHDLGRNLPGTTVKNPLANGITIFPGGVPLYKNGKLVGAIGVSGDGVDQDDLIAYTGTNNFRPPDSIRSDALPETVITGFLRERITQLTTDFGFTFPAGDTIIADVVNSLDKGLEGIRLPYTKFPRNPDL